MAAVSKHCDDILLLLCGINMTLLCSLLLLWLLHAHMLLACLPAGVSLAAECVLKLIKIYLSMCQRGRQADVLLPTPAAVGQLHEARMQDKPRSLADCQPAAGGQATGRPATSVAVMAERCC